MLGRPASCEPVCTNVIAGSWLIASVCIERMMQMSSTMPAVCGKQLADRRAALAVPGEPEDRRRDREVLLPRSHRRDSLTHPHRIRQLDARAGWRSPTCRRRGPSATERPTGRDRSPAWPWPGNAAEPGVGRAAAPAVILPTRPGRGALPSRPSSEPSAIAPRPTPELFKKTRRFDVLN